MFPNHAGIMINKWWQKISEKFPDIELDEFIIMPNHFHAIVINIGSVGADPCVCPDISHSIDTSNGMDIPQSNDINIPQSNDINIPQSNDINILQSNDINILQSNDINILQSNDINILQSNVIGTLGEHMGSPLHRVVQWFKTMTTNEYIRNVKSNGWKPFDKKLWQRNYYEHVIRDKKSYQRIKNYIINNPTNWS
jgi:REP element-mobilizing transposase RayT